VDVLRCVRNRIFEWYATWDVFANFPSAHCNYMVDRWRTMSDMCGQHLVHWFLKPMVILKPAPAVVSEEL
jgi:hypothetical protein